VKPSLPIFAPAMRTGISQRVNHYEPKRKAFRRVAWAPLRAYIAIMVFPRSILLPTIPASLQGDPGSHIAAKPDHVTCALRWPDCD
jgi:hypothetical protein